MSDLIQQWLIANNVNPNYIETLSAFIGVLLLLSVCWLSFYIAKHQVLSVVYKIVSRSKNKTDDLLFTHQVFDRVAWLIPGSLMLLLAPFFLSNHSEVEIVIVIFARVAITLQFARSLSALLNVTNSLFQEKSKDRYLPLNATIQLLKLAIYLVSIIIAISTVIDRSPLYILSGLGALTAVLLLVFQDTIKGLVASVQISANRMLTPGDWIEMPQYGADGSVQEIGLNTVKVKNWDNTVTTIPTYALISESFKNWRGMSTSGGRRIKRSISIDLTTIKFCNQDLLEKLAELKLLKNYLASKNQQLREYHQQSDLADDNDPNKRHLTNIGTFRAYITEYLKQHPNVHPQMTCMVRLLEPSPTGIEMELYFFSNDTNWVNFELIQSDIFDHLLAIVPLFELRVFQSPSGFDWQQSGR